MIFVCKKSGVNYGVNTSDAAITDLANIGTLKPGSFLFAHDNGNIIKVDGTITTASTAPPEYGVIWYNDGNGGIRCSMPIVLSNAKLVKPLPDIAAAAKTVTIDFTFPTITVEKYSGLYMHDNTKHYTDEMAEMYADVYLGAGVTQTAFNTAVLKKVKTIPLVASASFAGNVLTIVFVSGVNPTVMGYGYFEQTPVNVTQKLAYADSLTGTELKYWAEKNLSVFDGKRSNYLEGNVQTFNKVYDIDPSKKYLVYQIKYQTVAGGYPMQSSPSMISSVYIAIVEGELAATNEGYKDIFNAFLTNVGADSGAAGADAADN